MRYSMRTRICAIVLGAIPAILVPSLPRGAEAQTALPVERDTAARECPSGWVASSAPGGCSPGFFTLKLARFPESNDCPDGWVRSSVPGGCSPGFLTLALNDVLGDGECPAGWVTSEAPGGCSPGYLTLRQAGIELATEGCPSGWVASSAPGGCSPGSFTLEERRIYSAHYTCAFGVECDVMVEAILALGGSCERDGPDSSCDLPPLVEE